MAARPHHDHHKARAGDARLGWAVAINLALTAAQVIGGILSGSLALIADAVHNFSDAMSLIIAYSARKLARRPPDAEMTFGYRRAEAVAALVNYTTLILLGLYLAWEAILRFIDPQGVDGWVVVIVAGIALAIDIGTAALTYTMSKDSVNIRAAFLHNLADALGSVAVIVAGTMILLYDWRLADPIATLLIAGYVLWMSLSEIGEVIRILMLGSPPHLDAAEVVETVRRTPGVMEVHNARIWQIDEHASSADLHVVIEEGAWSKADSIKAEVRRRLRGAHGIEHATVEMECARHACAGAPLWGN